MTVRIAVASWISPYKTKHSLHVPQRGNTIDESTFEGLLNLTSFGESGTEVENNADLQPQISGTPRGRTETRTQRAKRLADRAEAVPAAALAAAEVAEINGDADAEDEDTAEEAAAAGFSGLHGLCASGTRADKRDETMVQTKLSDRTGGIRHCGVLSLRTCALQARPLVLLKKSSRGLVPRVVALLLHWL